RTASTHSESSGPSSPGRDTTGQSHPNAEQADDRTTGSALRPHSGDDCDPVESWVKLRRPTSQCWLSEQATTVATVPFRTLTGDSDLPGTLDDGSPIPAEVARTIAGRSKTIQRILTDPATGTPLDAKATSYPVPKDLRKTLIEQWNCCA